MESTVFYNLNVEAISHPSCRAMLLRRNSLVQAAIKQMMSQKGLSNRRGESLGRFLLAGYHRNFNFWQITPAFFPHLQCGNKNNNTAVLVCKTKNNAYILPGTIKSLIYGNHYNNIKNAVWPATAFLPPLLCASLPVLLLLRTQCLHFFPSLRFY